MEIKSLTDFIPNEKVDPVTSHVSSHNLLIIPSSYDYEEEKKMDKIFQLMNTYMDVYNKTSNSTPTEKDNIKRILEIKEKNLCYIDNYEDLGRDLLKPYEEKYKVPNCTYITKSILPYVYVCNCSLESLFIICGICKETCHSGHNLVKIDNSKLNLTCNCGEENHSIDENIKLVQLESKCLLNDLYKNTVPRLFYKLKNSINSDIICNYCYINSIESVNPSNYDFTVEYELEKNYDKIYSTLENSFNLNSKFTCNCETSIPIPIKAFMNYYDSVYALKTGKYFSRLYFLEHNINLLTISENLFTVFNDVFKDIKNYSNNINEDNEEGTFLVEDQDLLKIYGSVFSILSQEKSFNYIQVIDVFNFLSLDEKIKIIKIKIDRFSLRSFDIDVVDKDKENETIVQDEYLKNNIDNYYSINDVEKFNDYEKTVNRKSIFNNKGNNENAEKTEYQDKPRQPIANSIALIETINEYFFSIYQFYIHIKNFYVKYNNLFNVFTILNMNLYQRKYYILNSLEFGRSYLGTHDKLYESELIEVKKAIFNLPDLYLDWYEKILNINLTKFFSEELDVGVHFLDVFTFLCRYDLLGYNTRIRLYNVILDMLRINIEKNIKSSNSEISEFIYLKIDRVFEIIFYCLCYYNDRIILSKINSIKKKNLLDHSSSNNYSFRNSENEEEKFLIAKIFTTSIDNVDILFSQLNYIKESRIKINVSKINCLIKKILDLYLGNSHSQESESYLLGLINLSRINYKVNYDFNYEIVNGKEKDARSVDFIIMNKKLSSLNNRYFQYKCKIHDYIASLKLILNKEIKQIVQRNKIVLADMENNFQNSKSNPIENKILSNLNSNSNKKNKDTSNTKHFTSRVNINSSNQIKKKSLILGSSYKNSMLKLSSVLNENEESKLNSNFNVKNTYKEDSLTCNSLYNVQLTFKITNFLQNFKQILYIISSSLKFFEESILKKEDLALLMDFILICVYNDYENISLITDCNYMQFFEVFKDIGLKDFLLNCSFLVYDKIYQFDNYMFITNLIILYFYYIDPSDAFSFNHYFFEYSRCEVIQKLDNFITNLRYEDIDYFYSLNLYIQSHQEIAKYKSSSHSEIPLLNVNTNINIKREKEFNLNELIINLEYPFIADSSDYWVTSIARITRFFLFLDQIIESKDFVFEENIKIFELMEYKISNLNITNETILETIKNKDTNFLIRNLLEEFLFYYYKFFNLLFKRGLYDLEILKEKLKFISDDDLKEFDKFDLGFLTTEWNLSIELSNQILIFVSFNKTNLFLGILSEDSLIKNKDNFLKRFNNRKKNNSKSDVYLVDNVSSPSVHRLKTNDSFKNTQDPNSINKITNQNTVFNFNTIKENEDDYTFNSISNNSKTKLTKRGDAEKLPRQLSLFNEDSSKTNNNKIFNFKTNDNHSNTKVKILKNFNDFNQSNIHSNEENNNRNLKKNNNKAKVDGILSSSKLVLKNCSLNNLSEQNNKKIISNNPESTISNDNKNQASKNKFKAVYCNSYNPDLYIIEAKYILSPHKTNSIINKFYISTTLKEKTLKLPFYKKCLIANTINSYLEVENRKNNNNEDNYDTESDYLNIISIPQKLKLQITKLFDFITNQLVNFDEILAELQQDKSNFTYSVNLFETFEYTIVKPLIYINSILKETESLVPGKYNYTYFKLLCYFFNTIFLLYTLNISRNRNLYDIEDELSPSQLKFIYQALEMLLTQKIIYFQSDILHKLFNDVIKILYLSNLDNTTRKKQENNNKNGNNDLNLNLSVFSVNLNNISNINRSSKNESTLFSSKSNNNTDENTKLNQVFEQIYSEYKEELDNLPSDDLSLIKIFDYSDEVFNHGAEIISYLLKNQKYSLSSNEISEYVSKKIPTSFLTTHPNSSSNKKKNKSNNSKDVSIFTMDFRNSKLRLFNYLCYLTTLSVRSSKKFQEELIEIGIQGVQYTAFIVFTFVEKLFILLHENVKKSHKDYIENESSIFLAKFIKIALDYLLSSSENFNQQIQSMYINVTDLYSKLSFNLLKIIYLFEELEIKNKNLKEIAQEYTDILLNLFMNTIKDNMSKIYIEKKVLLDNQTISKLKIHNQAKIKSNDRVKKVNSRKLSNTELLANINNCNNNIDNNRNYLHSKFKKKKPSSTQLLAGETNEEYKTKSHQTNNTNSEPNISNKIELILKENDLLVNLFYKVSEIFQIKNIYRILNLKLLKTYANIMKLASTLITTEKKLTSELRKIFVPSDLLEFLTMSIKIIYLKYGKQYEFNDEKIMEFQNQISQINNIKFKGNVYKEMKNYYYNNTKIYEDDLFNLCCDIFIFINWLYVNGDIESQKLFKRLDEDYSSKDEEKSSKLGFFNKEDYGKSFIKLIYFNFTIDIKNKSMVFNKNDNNYFEQWNQMNTLISSIKKIKFDITPEENSHSLKFFYSLLKSIDINSEVIKYTKIVLERNSKDKLYNIHLFSNNKTSTFDNNDSEFYNSISKFSRNKNTKFLNISKLILDTAAPINKELSNITRFNNRFPTTNNPNTNYNDALTNTNFKSSIINSKKNNSTSNFRKETDNLSSMINYSKNRNKNRLKTITIETNSTNHKLTSNKNKTNKQENEINNNYSSDSDSDSEGNEQNKLKKVYFIENPLIKLISEQKLLDFFERTERSSWVVKVSSILTLYKEVLHEIIFNTNLKERSIWLYYTLNLDYYKSEVMTFIIVIGINFLSLLRLKLENLTDRSLTEQKIMLGFGIFLLIYNSVCLLIYMSSRYRYLIDFETKKLEDKIAVNNNLVANSLNKSDTKLESINSFSSKITIYFINNILYNSTPMFFIANIILGGIAMVKPETTYCYTILLLFYSKFSKIANMIIRAFKSGMKNLVFMILFLMIIVWTISLIAFDLVNDEYYIPIEGGVEENICSTIVHCYISFLNYGVRNDGGIGDIMPKRNPHINTVGFYGRFLIDFIFFVIVILLFLNMINGIIINTFSQLREEQETKKLDVENNCFICNLDKNTFQKRKIQFIHHVTKQHGIKDYLLFLINVTLKPEKDLDPDETRVINALKKNDVSFFPCEKALDWNWTLVENDTKDE